jgi:hypothetical protein
MTPTLAMREARFLGKLRRFRFVRCVSFCAVRIAGGRRPVARSGIPGIPTFRGILGIN